ncbi:Replication protein A 70 kDa DNA-binding subunit B, partial [Linum perenne]
MDDSGVLLRSLPRDRSDAPLVLRLLNSWKVGNPATPDQFFAFGTLWCDEEGTVVEGNSHRGHIDILGPRLSDGSVYKVTGYGLQMPRKPYRAASYDRMLTLSPVTSFKLISSPSPTFAVNAFEFIQFGLLHTHVIGRAISVSRRNHIDVTHGMAKAQVVVLVDAQSVEFSVTLWEDFSLILDPVALAEADLRKPVVIGFAGLMVSGFNSVVFGRSSAGTRIVVNPPVRETKTLQKKYQKTKGSLKCVDVPFDTPEKRSQHVADSYRTVSQLLALLSNPSDLDAKYRCLVTVVDFDMSQPWFYRGCSSCYRAVAPNQERYKIKMRASDDTGTATFVLLGRTADYVMPVSAADLAFDNQPSTNVVPACDPSVSPSASKRPVADVNDLSGESDDSDVSHRHSPLIATPIPKEVSSLPGKASFVGVSCDEGACQESVDPVVSSKQSPLLSTEISKNDSSVQTPVESSDLSVSEELSNPGVSVKRSQNKSDLADCLETVGCLSIGRSEFPILLRLIHVWQCSSDESSDDFPPLYTLWLDSQFKSVVEDPDVPFFPTIALSPLCFRTFRNCEFSTVHRDPDLCGVLLSITNLSHSVADRTKFMAVLIDHRYQVPIRCSDATWDINFVLNHDAATMMFRTPICQFVRLSSEQKFSTLVCCT